MKVLSKNNKVLLADGQAVKWQSGGVEQVTWHQCTEAVRNYLDNVTYDPNDYTTSQIANYAPATAVLSNTKPIGKTVDGVTYYNEVPNIETPFSTEKKAGTLKPLDKLRWLNTSTENVRDLGGWSCDGGTVKYGMLFRGGEPSVSDKSLMVDTIGVKHELQLSGNESPRNYSLWGIGFSKFDAYHWYSIADKQLWKEELKVVFDCIIHNRPLYFHCYSGADRTGTLACVLEALLGMSQSDIDKDYELTNFYIGTDTDLHARRRNEAEWQSLINAIMSVPLVGGLSDSFRNRAVSFVLSLGFAIDEINAFRTAMIDGTPTAITVSLDSFSITKSGENVTFDNNISSVDEFQGYKVNLSADSGYVISNVTVYMDGNIINAFDGKKVNLFHKVTNTLSHCATNNDKIGCIDGQGYGAIITAEKGYTLDGGAISIKVGGVEMAQQYYSNGSITIPNVDGNVEIHVTAVQQGPSYTNLADSTSEDWLTDKRISSSGVIGDSNGAIVTNFIPCTESDVIRVKYLNMNTNLPDTNSSRIGFYNSSKEYLSQAKLDAYTPKMTDEGNGVYAITLSGLASAFSYIRINNSITSGQIASDVIITVNEEIN